MKIGAMNDPLADYLEEIEWIGQHGFDFVDLTYEAPKNLLYDWDKIKELLAQYNLKVVGHSDPSLPAVYPVKEIREVALLELKKAALFFKEVGAEKMSIHPFYNSPHLNELENFEENIKVFQLINNFCRSIDLQLMIENYRSPFDTPEEFAKIFQAVPGMKLHLDVGHCNLEGDAEKTVARFFEKFKDDIIHLHIHDNDGDADEHLPLGCGCGDIKWSNIINTIKKAGYDNTITLEVFCEDPDFLLLSREKLLKLWAETNG